MRDKMRDDIIVWLEYSTEHIARENSALQYHTVKMIFSIRILQTI